MAEPRSSPYIWTTWLARLLVGDAPCLWQYWYQSHNKLTEKEPDDFNRVAWKMDHARMADELRRELTATGIKPIMSHRFKIPAAGNAIIAGEVDCLVVGKNEFCVYDCKTGMPHSRDNAQVMVYMYALLQQPAFRDKVARGIVAYRNTRVEIPGLPFTFETNLNYFVDLLVTDSPAPKSPGESCAECQVTANDCADRFKAS